MNYLLSIIIPTRNRLLYLSDCLNTINDIPSEEIEVVIQDNSDDHEKVKELVDSFNNNNFFYYYCGDKLSQTENSDLALSHATGEFITYIGDDDSICDDLLTVAKCMQQNNIDACKYGISIYNWPDLLEKVSGLNSFTAPKCIGSIRYLNAKNELINVLKNGVQSVAMLPRVYHGIVSKALLDELYCNAGSYFPGPSPDMANAVGCAIFSDRFIELDVPLIVSGYGGSSAGGLGKRKLHKGSLKNNFQLKNDVEEKWPQKVPKLWMGCTMWPSSAISSLNALNKMDYVTFINYGIIYGETFLQDRHSLKSIMKCKVTVIEALQAVKYIMIRIYNKLRNNTPQYDMVVEKPITLSEALKIQNDLNRRINIIGLFDSLK